MGSAVGGRQVQSEYAIRVQGRLDPRWTTWFDGCTLTSAGDGTTLITAAVPDQAALHGVLQALRDLGLPLLSVSPVQQDPPPCEGVPT